MRTIKTYSKGAPFYNAFIGTWPTLSGGWLFLNESENICHTFVGVRDGNVVGVAR
jgi:hypothetical protein